MKILLKYSYRKNHFFNIKLSLYTVVCKIYKNNISKFFFVDIKDIILIQISFDGNNSINPPNVINESIFESVKRNVEWDIASYVNIIYTDTFEDCDINRSAVRELYSLSNKH